MLADAEGRMEMNPRGLLRALGLGLAWLTVATLVVAFVLL
jgi:hypothetical protein